MPPTHPRFLMMSVLSVCDPDPKLHGSAILFFKRFWFYPEFPLVELGMPIQSRSKQQQHKPKTHTRRATPFDTSVPDRLLMRMQLSISTPFLMQRCDRTTARCHPPPALPSFSSSHNPSTKLDLPRMTVQRTRTQGPTPNLWPFR